MVESGNEGRWPDLEKMASTSKHNERNKESRDGMGKSRGRTRRDASKLKGNSLE